MKFEHVHTHQIISVVAVTEIKAILLTCRC